MMTPLQNPQSKPAILVVEDEFMLLTVMAETLRDAGYQVESPEATFYLLPRAPIADDRTFCGRLADHDILCMPGSVFDLPGYFRVSITANDQMIDRAIPGFRAAME